LGSAQWSVAKHGSRYLSLASRSRRRLSLTPIYASTNFSSFYISGHSIERLRIIEQRFADVEEKPSASVRISSAIRRHGKTLDISELGSKRIGFTIFDEIDAKIYPPGR
jgi:hypothetical protein